MAATSPPDQPGPQPETPPTQPMDPVRADATPEPPAATPLDPPGGAGPQPAIMTPPPRAPRFGSARRLWGEATASPGARVATIVALVLATAVVIGGVTTAAVAVARHGEDGRGTVRVGQGGGPDGPRFGPQNRGEGQQPRGRLAPEVPGRSVGPGAGGPRGGLGAGGSLHGEFTQGQPATTYLFQRGTVTASSSTSLSVKSSDGFTATYAVSDSTRVTGARGATVTVGSEVVVVATKTGSAAVQVRVVPAGVGVLPNGTT